ncbi:hypothetical protein T310_9666, partial [Rasamsonia emersonii CBS 393.64]
HPVRAHPRHLAADRHTMSSILNFAEQFFTRFTYVTKTIFDKKVTEDVYYIGSYRQGVSHYILMTKSGLGRPLLRRILLRTRNGLSICSHTVT